MSSDSGVTWHLVGRLEEIEEGKPKQLEADDIEIAVHKVAGKIHAIDNICTHAFARLSFGTIEDNVITCPLHLAKFDIVTGKVLEGPAEENLETYPVKCANGLIYVGVTEEVPHIA